VARRLTPNLPLQRTSFVGRQRELDDIKTLLAGGQLVTLTGAGGCGKTRLALQVAWSVSSDYADGAWLVELAPVPEGSGCVHAMATALGVREAPDRPLTDALVEFLRDKNLLLVLDNCEHVVDAAARAVDAVLEACPHVRILATSREPLACVGETTWRVPSLTEPEAVKLFVERARAVRPGREISVPENAVITEICERLDGIPLAIELAAARVRVFSIEQIAARLGDRFRLLSAGPRTVAPRQQTLLAAVEWSYALLSEPERAVLRRLAVFAGGWTFDAAEAVAAGADVHRYAVLDLLAQLASKSLVVVDEQQPETRYRLLETIRQFALDRLAEASDVQATYARHIDFFVDLAERAEPLLRGPHALDVVERLEAERDNFRTALEWGIECEPRMALRLAAALGWLWWLRSYHTEGRRWLARALHADPAPTPLRARALHAAGWLAHHQRDLEEAQTCFEESLSIARRMSDDWAVAWALHGLGRVAYFRNDPSNAHALGSESLAIAEKVNDRWLMAHALHLLGIAAYLQAEYATSRAYYQRSLAIRREIGDREGTSILQSLLGIVAIRQRQFDDARAHFIDAVNEMRGLLSGWGLSMNVATFAGLAGAQGQYADAVTLAGASAALRAAWQTPLIPLMEAIVEESLAAAREALGPMQYAECWATGQSMSAQEALAAVLAVTAARVEPANELLSPTERQVLRLLARGHTTKEIATELVMAVSTADRHITHIYNKLGVRNRAEATAYAVQHGQA
jgi:predicted ATPase/DNA-binding CsgD family transcriptional regulator